MPSKKKREPGPRQKRAMKSEGGGFGPSAIETEQTKTQTGVGLHRDWWKKKKAKGIKPKKTLPKGSKSQGDPWWKQHNV